MPQGQTIVPVFGYTALVDGQGNVVSPATNSGSSPSSPQYTTSAPLPAGTDRSGTATTTSQSLIPANANRVGLIVQNVGANNVGINEFGNTASIGTAGTYTLAPGASVKINTNRAVSFIAATGSTPFSATEF